MLQRQRFVNLYAGIALPNPASVALHEAIGMRRIGVYEGVGSKFGAWHDVGPVRAADGRAGLPLAEPDCLSPSPDCLSLSQSRCPSFSRPPSRSRNRHIITLAEGRA